MPLVIPHAISIIAEISLSVFAKMEYAHKYLCRHTGDMIWADAAMMRAWMSFEYQQTRASF